MAEQSAISEVIMRGKTNGIATVITRVNPSYRMITGDTTLEKTITFSVSKGQKLAIACFAPDNQSVNFTIKSSINITKTKEDYSSYGTKNCALITFEADSDGTATLNFAPGNSRWWLFDVEDDFAGDIIYTHTSTSLHTINSPKNMCYFIGNDICIGLLASSRLQYAYQYVPVDTNLSGRIYWPYKICLTNDKVLEFKILSQGTFFIAV